MLIIAFAFSVLNIDIDTAIYGTVILYCLMLYLLYKAEGYFSLTVLFSVTYGVFLFGRHFSYVFSLGESNILSVGFLSKARLTEGNFCYWAYIFLAALVLFTMMSILAKIKFGSDCSFKKDHVDYQKEECHLHCYS